MQRKRSVWAKARGLCAVLAGLVLLMGCAGGGEGTLRVEGPGTDGFEVFDAAGQRKMFAGISGSETNVLSGRYVLFVNGAGARILIRGGRRLVVKLAALSVEGLGADAYEVLDPTGARSLLSRSTGTMAELLPGAYRVKLNGIVKTLELEAGEHRVLATGALRVPDDGPPLVTVYDTEGQRLVFRGAGKPIELLPGAYVADYAGEKTPITIKGNAVLELTPDSAR